MCVRERGENEREREKIREQRKRNKVREINESVGRERDE